MLEKKKLRDIAESISGIRPENRSLEGIVNFIEEKAEITYEKEPRTFLGRLRELGYALNGVRPTQRSLRGIVNNIYENFSPVPPVSNKIYGVKNLFSSAQLERTDDASNMGYIINLDGTVTSDFDNVFPYNQMKKVDIKNTINNVYSYFVKIPSMWFRIGTTQYNQITDIAVSQVKGEGDNWYQTKEFYYSAYKGMKTTVGGISYLCSQGSPVPVWRDTLANFRQYANNDGEGYQLLDLYHRTIMNFLFLIEFAVKKTSTLFTMTYNTQQETASTDSIITPTGALENGRFRWHYIEDFFGNTMEYVDGVSGNYYASSDASKYESGDLDELNYTNTSNANYIKCFCWDSVHPFLVMAQTTGSANYFDGELTNTMATTDMATKDYICGKPYTNNGEGYNTLGAFSFSTKDKSDTTSYLSTARLLYCPNGV